MDKKQVFEGVKYFYETILSSALNSTTWDNTSIANAFRWAEFCEQVFTQFSKRTSIKEIDDIIHAIGESLIPPTSICFGDLKNSTQNLCQAFFENPNFEYEIKNKFTDKELEKFPSSETCEDSALLDCLCEDLIESLKPISLFNSDRSLYYEIKADVFLHFVISCAKHHATEDQSEVLLSSSLDALCKNEEQMMILLHILLHRCDKYSQNRVEIQEYAFNWIVLRMLGHKNGMLSQFLFKQPPSTLRTLASYNAAFLGCYLNFLSDSASSLNQGSENGILQWMTKSSSKEMSMSFNQIVSHFQSLVSLEDEVGRATREHLASQANALGASSMWNKILTSVTNRVPTGP